MATLTAAKITEAGVDDSSSTTASNGGDEFVNTGIEFLKIQNYDSSTTYTVRVEVQTASILNQTYGVLTKSSQDKSLAATGEVAIEGSPDKCIYMGPFKQGAFNDTDNKVQIKYSTGTTYDASNAIGGSAKLKVQVLYLEN